MNWAGWLFLVVAILSAVTVASVLVVTVFLVYAQRDSDRRLLGRIEEVLATVNSVVESTSGMVMTMQGHVQQGNEILATVKAQNDRGLRHDGQLQNQIELVRAAVADIEGRLERGT